MSLPISLLKLFWIISGVDIIYWALNKKLTYERTKSAGATAAGTSLFVPPGGAAAPSGDVADIFTNFTGLMYWVFQGLTINLLSIMIDVWEGILGDTIVSPFVNFVTHIAVFSFVVFGYQRIRNYDQTFLSVFNNLLNCKNAVVIWCAAKVQDYVNLRKIREIFRNLYNFARTAFGMGSTDSGASSSSSSINGNDDGSSGSSNNNSATGVDCNGKTRQRSTKYI